MKRILPLLVALVVFVSVNTHAQGKLGYINPDEVLSVMPEIRQADTALAKFQQSLEQNYQGEQKDLNDAIDKFIKDSVNMTASMKEIRRKELQDRVTALGAKESELNQQLEKEKERLLTPIRDKLFKAIKDVAKENGYVHVLYKGQAIVFPASDDLAALVRKKLGIK